MYTAINRLKKNTAFGRWKTPSPHFRVVSEVKSIKTMERTIWCVYVMRSWLHFQFDMLNVQLFIPVDEILINISKFS